MTDGTQLIDQETLHSFLERMRALSTAAVADFKARLGKDVRIDRLPLDRVGEADGILKELEQTEAEDSEDPFALEG